MAPLGWKKGEPGAIGWSEKRSSCWPSRRWSRCFASSMRFRYAVEVLLAGPRGAVDALEHLVAAVAPPVGAGDAGQPEGGDVTRRRHVGTPAEVDELALPVEGHDVLGDAADDLHLVVLAHALEEPDGFLTGQLLAAHRKVLGDDGAHRRLDLLQVLRGEPLWPFEVVVEAVLDHGTDRDLGAGEQPLHGLRHQMRARVPEHVEPFGRVRRHGREATVLAQRAAQVDDPRAVTVLDASGDRAPQLLAPGAVVLGVNAQRISGGGSRGQTLLRPVGKGHDDLGHPGLHDERRGRVLDERGQ